MQWQQIEEEINTDTKTDKKAHTSLASLEPHPPYHKNRTLPPHKKTTWLFSCPHSWRLFPGSALPKYLTIPGRWESRRMTVGRGHLFRYKRRLHGSPELGLRQWWWRQRVLQDRSGILLEGTFGHLASCQTKKICLKFVKDAYTSIAARGGGGSFKRLKLYNSEEHVPIESFVTTLIHWAFFLMTRTKLAFVGFVATGNSMWHQVLDDLCLVVTDQSATTCDSSYAPNSTQYNSVLQSSEKCYPSSILYYKVLLQKVLLQYYKVLIQYYSVLQSTSPVLLRTTKYYSSTTPYCKVLQSTTSYYKVLVQYYSVLQSTTPVLLRTTKYYSSTTSYYKVLLRTTKY